jgi:outer membrane lipoprotein carrier protein
MNKQKCWGAMALVSCTIILALHSVWAADIHVVLQGLQRRYSSVTSIKGSFQQTYRAPGIEQTESGMFWIKKPGFMRWEYRNPEEKLFIADGKESFLYTPQERQVVVQPFSLSDLHRTPLEFLLGAGNILKSYDVSWELASKPKSANALMIRLTPKDTEPEYSYIILEINPDSYELQGILIREHSGNTSRFAFADMAMNVNMKDKDFQFKTPKGVEVLRFNDEEQ